MLRRGNNRLKTRPSSDLLKWKRIVLIWGEDDRRFVS